MIKIYLHINCLLIMNIVFFMFNIIISVLYTSYLKFETIYYGLPIHYTNLITELIFFYSTEGIGIRFWSPHGPMDYNHWGVAKKSNLNKIQDYQNITLRKITNAPSFISNQTLNDDMHMKTIEKESVVYHKRFIPCLDNHENPLTWNINTLSLLEVPPLLFLFTFLYSYSTKSYIITNIFLSVFKLSFASGWLLISEFTITGKYR